MANPEHLKILKQGVEVWNKWRREQRTLVPDLREANMSNMDLRGVYLFGTELSGANLAGANLSQATISESNLESADLDSAILVQAYITASNLKNANLANANLNSSKLWQAQLTKADLSGANLSAVDFEKSNLSGANLENSDLTSVDVFGAYLIHTKLARANLAKSSFRWARLSEADLSGANLEFAVFSYCSLTGADFADSVIGNTVFGDVSLSDARGLARCSHTIPSVIDSHTLEKSPGLPVGFLRGCGTPDDLISWYQVLHTQSIHFYSCFISYSSKDQEFADRLSNDLWAKNIDCFQATKDMKIGDEIWPTLDQAIRLKDKLIVILSERSIKSSWVKDEVQTAYEEERKRKKSVLFPIHIDSSVMDTNEPWASKLRQRYIGDFTNWKDHNSYQQSFNKLLRDLEAG